MKQTDVSQLFSTPFGAQADSTTITTIPQTKPATGRASMQLGFSKDNGTPIAAGGTPPYLEDMNGILNALARSAQAAELGVLHPFSAAYAEAIGGYPSGATISHPTIAGRALICTQDGNSNDPAQNMAGWVDPLASLSTALASEIQRAEQAEAAIFQVPAWVPLPCPFTTAPAGFVLAQGQSFSTSQCPQLALAFPSGFVPDMRGLVMRGYDPTGNVDIDGATRAILSFQEGSLLPADPVYGNITAVTGFGTGNSARANLGYENSATSRPISIAYTNPGTTQPSNTGNYGVARMKNMNWNFMFRAA